MADHPRLDFTVSLQEFGPAVPGALAKGKVLVVEYESEDNDEYIELSAPGPGVNGSDGHVVEAFIRGCYFGYRSSTSGTTIRVESRITRRERKTEEQENEVRQKEKLEQENKELRSTVERYQRKIAVHAYHSAAVAAFELGCIILLAKILSITTGAEVNASQIFCLFVALTWLAHEVGPKGPV